jgi:hypothetical protein
MYNITDIKNILNDTETCPKVSGERICNKLKKGNTSFNTKLINTYQDIEYLLLKNNLDSEVINCLIDKIQDICEDCITSSGISNIVDVSEDCHENNIISEEGYCLITESGKNIISE